MLDSVQPLLAEHAALQEQLSEASVHANPVLAKKLNRRYAELNAIVAAYNMVNQVTEDLAAVKELAKEDEAFVEEVPANEEKLHEANEKLRRLLIPRDPDDGRDVIMIGHEGHPEVEGTMGQADDGIHLVETVDDVEQLHPAQVDHLAYVTQTTLSVDDCRAVIDALKRRFPLISEPKKQDICYATQNRQDAVKFMAPNVDVVVVVGSHTSSNSNRLREVAKKLGTESYMVDSEEELQAEWFEGRHRVGLTAGASAPEILVQAVIDRIKAMGAISVRKMNGIEETIKFPLPKGLKIES
jgi:hypothetical protein